MAPASGLPSDPPPDPEEVAFLDKLSEDALMTFLAIDINSKADVFNEERIGVIQETAERHAREFGETLEIELKYGSMDAGLSARYFREVHVDGTVHECAVFAHGFNNDPWKVITVICK